MIYAPKKPLIMKINIYLNQEEKEKIEDLKAKYKCSLSTICDKVVFYTYKALLHYSNNENNIENLQNQYIDNKNNKKTSCNPKCFNDREIFTSIKNKNLFTTNCIKIYLAKSINKYVKEEGIKEYWKDINSALQKTKEQYWDYNHFIRNEVRMIKHNKEYLKRKLEQIK